MSRFETVGGVSISIDRIISFWHEKIGNNYILHVKMDNGDIHEEVDNGRVLESYIEGREHVIQVIPCVKPLYARYGEQGKIVEDSINYLGLCASGEIRPLEICSNGFWFADDTDNYLGLYKEALEGELLRQPDRKRFCV